MSGYNPWNFFIKADEILDKFLYYCSSFLLIILSFAVIYTVFTRYVFNMSPAWAEDAPRVFFLWLTYLGIAVATRRGENIRVTFFIEKLSHKKRFYLDIFMHVCILIMVSVLFWYSWPLVSLNFKTVMLSTGWPNAVSWLPLPIGCFLILIYQTKIMVKSIYDFSILSQNDNYNNKKS
ncbi:MAG: hypothetical protein CFH01_00817 [Alphaproteobacteria bacterium MarineAlpha2_Bin1]|nr:MAG: hypothetical protein CFH01_00817 [Alphaproteobacteria bacterium MarineAlpha2_Bin1]|tara:strand:+ start:810 stop:1343 length:534 start_codon:yes stop_codon:yes gene_type:complete